MSESCGCYTPCAHLLAMDTAGLSRVIPADQPNTDLDILQVASANPFPADAPGQDMAVGRNGKERWESAPLINESVSSSYGLAI